MKNKGLILKQRQISVGDLCVQVVQKPIKNLYLRVYPETGNVVLSAPGYCSVQELESFLLLRKDWIKKHLARKVNRPSINKMRLEQGEKVLVWGAEKVLMICRSTKASKVELSESSILALHLRKGADADSAQRVLKEFYRSELKRVIPQIIATYEPVMKVKVNEFGVKQMKTRWGSCNIRARRIWLNLDLAMREQSVLEYIVVHEMVHLIERQHNKRFYRLMEQFMPDWKDREVRLKSGLKSC